jgi:hypothetical protein
LMEKLPHFAKRWVAEAEAKKMRHQPILEVALDANMASGDVASSIETWIGVAPHRVEVRGGSVYLVHFRDEKVSNKLLEFNGRVLNSSKNRVRVRVVEQRMGMDDIFYEVITQMEIQEKTNALQKNAPSQDAYIRKAQRERRKEEDENDSLLSGFGHGGGGRPPSPPIRPPSQPPQVMPSQSFGPMGGGCSTPRPAPVPTRPVQPPAPGGRGFIESHRHTNPCTPPTYFPMGIPKFPSGTTPGRGVPVTAPRGGVLELPSRPKGRQGKKLGRPGLCR